MAVQFDDSEALGAWAEKFRVVRARFESGQLAEVEFAFTPPSHPPAIYVPPSGDSSPTLPPDAESDPPESRYRSALDFLSQL